MDQQRIAQIAQKFLMDNGTTAITDWTPSDLNRLEVDLHNTIMREYPGLDPNLRFRITQSGRVRAHAPLVVHVEISQVLGEVKVKV